MVIDQSLEWSIVKDKIYAEMGCTKTVYKPVLQWKFDKRSAKALPLTDDKDWDTFKDEVTREKAKTPINILVDEKVCCCLKWTQFLN